MYCNNCGKNNPEGSKFCQHCGIKFQQNTSIPTVENNSITENPQQVLINQNISPYPYVISLWKFFILSLVTFGIFNIYWFYRQWKSFYAIRSQNHGRLYIFFTSLFGGFSSFSLFKIIAQEAREIDPRINLEATGLSITFLVLNFLAKLPSPYWLLSSLSIFALLPVQNTINSYWEKKYGNKVMRSGFGAWNSIVCILGAIIVVLALIGTFNTNTSTTNTTNNTSVDAASADNYVTPTSVPTITPEDTWISYTAPDNEFTVQMPSYPLHKTDTSPSGVVYDVYTNSTDNENTGYFVSVYSINSSADNDTLLEASLNGFMQGVGSDAKITYRNYSYMGSYRTLDFVVTVQNLTMAGRFIVDNNTNKLYALFDSAYDNSNEIDGLKKFVSSFQINTQ